MIFFLHNRTGGAYSLFCRKNWAGEVMTFFEKGNGGMGNDFLHNRIGGANAFSAENIFVVFSYKLTPPPLKDNRKRTILFCDITFVSSAEIFAIFY